MHGKQRITQVDIGTGVSVVDPHGFTANQDPDPDFQLKADPDPDHGS